MPGYTDQHTTREMRLSNAAARGAKANSDAAGLSGTGTIQSSPIGFMWRNSILRTARKPSWTSTT